MSSKYSKNISNDEVSFGLLTDKITELFTEVLFLQIVLLSSPFRSPVKWTYIAAVSYQASEFPLKTRKTMSFAILKMQSWVGLAVSKNNGLLKGRLGLGCSKRRFLYECSFVFIYS